MKTISAKVDNELYELAIKIAEENGLTISAMIKQAITTATIKDKRVEVKLVKEINRIGNNLNQISRYINTKKVLHRGVLQSLNIIEKELNEVLP